MIKKNLETLKVMSLCHFAGKRTKPNSFAHFVKVNPKRLHFFAILYPRLTIADIKNFILVIDVNHMVLDKIHSQYAINFM